MRSISFKRPGVILMACISPLLLQGCEAATSLTAGTYLNKKFNEKPPLTLTGYNYAAADMIASQSRYMISKQTVFETVPLVNIGEKPIGGGLGRVIVDQVGTRFTQLGYQVVPDSTLTGKRAPNGKGGVIGGTYAIVGKKILVNLRLQEVGGKLLGAYDYEIPISREVRELSGIKQELVDFF
jgi:hypothetical protein